MKKAKQTGSASVVGAPEQRGAQGRVAAGGGRHAACLPPQSSRYYPRRDKF